MKPRFITSTLYNTNIFRNFYNNTYCPKDSIEIHRNYVNVSKRNMNIVREVEGEI